MIITLDFETYWAQGFSLTKLTTEEYIRDKRFEIIGVAVKVDDTSTIWYTGTHEEIKVSLSKYDWAEATLVCHNTMFDGAILRWVLGIEPDLYIDTLSMARAIHGVDAGGSLAKLAIRYGLNEKGTEVHDAKGKHRENFSKAELKDYANYCINDVDITYGLYKILITEFPLNELSLIDMTLRMFICPVLKVDDAMLIERLDEVIEEKQTMLSSLKSKLNCDTDEAVRKVLASNKQFAELLVELGVKPPMKISNTTGKETYALAKNDVGFIELSEHEDIFIQELCAVRLGTKSTIEESRLERFIGIGARNKGYLPIPLKYYGAHTGRWSGMDSINAQNLPSRDKKKKALKNSIVAEDGYVVINCDSSQIEARVLAWLAGQDDVTEQFANQEDVYSIFASKIYDKTITKANPIERFVGKTCIAEGTLILTDHGEIPIEKITIKDRVWDGVEWVNHKGLIYQGEKNVITYNGLTATEDHGVFTKWGPIPFGVASSRMEKLIRTGVSGEAVRVSADYFKQNRTSREEHLRVREMYELWDRKTHMQRQPITWKDKWVSVLLPNKIKAFSNTWKQVRCYSWKVQQYPTQTIQQLWWTGDKMQFCFEDGVYSMGREELTTQRLQRSRNRPNRQQWRLFSNKSTSGNQTTTGSKSSQYYVRYMERGQNISSFMEREPIRTSSNCMQIYPSWFNRGRDNTKSMGLSKPQMQKLESNKTKVRVYDIADAGPRNRYTANGVLILNCILGLGFGTGAVKLQHTLKTQPPGADLPLEECESIVKLYRETNNKIISLWKDGDRVLKDLVDWEYTDFAGNRVSRTPYYYGENECLLITEKGIRLPNGLYIQYPNLHLYTEEAKSYHQYKSRMGMKSIWGGALVENVVQAIARIIVGEQMIKINERYRPALTVHDAAVCVVPEDELEEAEKFIVNIMSTPPSWAEGLPIACEFSSGYSYGDC